MANKKRAYPRLPVEDDSKQLWWNRWTKTTTPENYKTLWVTETWEYSNSLPDFETHGLPTTLKEIDSLCWNEHGTIALDQAEAPSAWEKTAPTEKSLIRGRKTVSPQGSRGKKYNFNLLEKAWRQVGDAKRKTNQYTRQY